ncbi:MAG: HAD-IA family hydrolase [Suipraeoptans sp.]
MKLKEELYHAFVNKVPGIKERYKKQRSRSKGIGRLYTWMYLIGLNISYYIFRNDKLKIVSKYPYYEEKDLYYLGSESSISKRESPKELAGILADHDVISLDVFDTLVFRPFSEPIDLFYILGEKLNYMDFKRIRVEMEWKARELKKKERNSYEVSLSEIYDLLSKETGIDKEVAMNLELELEYDLCFANPYMYRVVEELIKYDKKIIINSDMYLSTDQIKILLKRCGYPEFTNYYVSSDFDKSKSSGDLYELIKKEEGENLTYAHVGDNFKSDIEQAGKHGFNSFHYVNVNHVGNSYRPEDMSVITGAIYRGVINAQIHNGLCEFSREYEYGYIYGGLFVYGYCRFIHEYVKSNNIDKILFLSRDGDILSKAYEKLYQEESCKHEYVYWSRLAATKMAAKYYKYDYFRRFVYHKINQNYTIEQVLAAMELEDMTSDFCKAKEMEPTSMLGEKSAEVLKEYLMESWDYVLEHYEEQLDAGKIYYESVLKNCSKVVAVDIGWAGSGAITLDYIVNNIWNIDCEITGIVAGTNTCHNAEPDCSETYLQNGRIISYLYSQRKNRDLWKLHDPSKNHNLYWETLLDSPTGSLKGFYLDDQGKSRCEFKKAATNSEKIKEIQRGILDFIKVFDIIEKRTGFRECVSGRDAYAPMINVQSVENKKFVKTIDELSDDMNI